MNTKPLKTPSKYHLKSDYNPSGDQKKAIKNILFSFESGQKEQILLGVTGSGKTFTVANVISGMTIPTLVLAHNKILAAQLHHELQHYFPDHAVEYFVSYYDYYQPEAYLPTSDTYIAKDASINQAIDRLRHRATKNLLERQDIIIVSSVSCIYGIGSPDAYQHMLLSLHRGQIIERDSVLKRLVENQYQRNPVELCRSAFRVRGDIVEIFPASEDNRAIRVEWFGDEIEDINWIDPIRGTTISTISKVSIYPATHHVVSKKHRQRAIKSIREELEEHLLRLHQQKKTSTAERIEQRTLFDLETIEQMGYCNGIENYSRHFTGRSPGEPPPTLLDYFPEQSLIVIDESHQTIPQLRSMYLGDLARKNNLIDFGFRLPSARDNRPLKFSEFMQRSNKILYVSATPAAHELEKCHGAVTEQIIRPTGLVDPTIIVKPASSQIDDLLEEIQVTISKKHRILVTTLTKRMAEDLTDFLTDAGVAVRYLHSDIDTLKRIELIQTLRLGEYDVLVGINLLREGLDIPEVSLVAILDADKEGFLRSRQSLIQTIGRASRNVDGRVILYADKITKSIQSALDETDRRRSIQLAHNKKHKITPKSVTKPIQSASDLGPEVLPTSKRPQSTADPMAALEDIPIDKINKYIKKLNTKMQHAAKLLDFEQAATLRDQIKFLQQRHLRLG